MIDDSTAHAYHHAKSPLKIDLNHDIFFFRMYVHSAFVVTGIPRAIIPSKNWQVHIEKTNGTT